MHAYINITYIQVAELSQWLEAAAAQEEHGDELLTIHAYTCIHTYIYSYIQVAELFQLLEAAAVQKERDDERHAYIHT
jgi:hypothetical protein